MLQFRLTEKVRKLFGFVDSNLSEAVASDALLGNWYVTVCVLDGSQSLLLMSEVTFLSFVLLDVREDHADTLPNGFVNGLEHLLQSEKFAERSIRRLFEGIDIIEITKTADRRVLGKLSSIENMYVERVNVLGGLKKCDILDVMNSVNRYPDRQLDGISPIKATKKLLRNNDERLH